MEDDGKYWSGNEKTSVSKSTSVSELKNFLRTQPQVRVNPGAEDSPVRVGHHLAQASPRTTDPVLRSYPPAAEASVSTSGAQSVATCQLVPEGEYNTGVTGGRVDGSNVVGNVEAGATVTMIVKFEAMSLAEKIKQRTASSIEEWTAGMVATSALTKIMKKLNSGISWVTITGQPGEGKTTAAFMALNQLQKSGRDVFHVLSPQEFTEVTTTYPRPVILLDDLCGQLAFDHIAWSIWQPIINNILEKKEHTLYENKPNEKEVTVILVGRNYVLNDVSSDIGKVSKYFIDNKHVVFLSKTGERRVSEKKAILKAICESKGLKLDDYTINTMCRVNGPHGFPHTCQLFVTLRLQGVDIDTVEFMKTPLEFLNQTIQKFLDDSTTQFLFKEMIKRDGKLPASEIENLDNSYAVRKLADSLVDSYLRKEDNCFSFHHPSIYDSVAFNLTKYFPSFVIKQCSVSFLHARVRLEPSRDKQQSTSNSESNLVVNIPRSKTYITDLAKRFAAEIENRKLMLVLSHKVLTDKLFIEELKCHVKLPPTSLLTVTDKQTHQSFLWLLVSNKAFELLKYVISVEPDLNAKDSLDYTVLERLCTYSLNTDDVMRFLIDKGASVNTDDVSGRSPLHWACRYNKHQAVQCMLDHGANINSRDWLDYTPLHIAAELGSKDCLVVLLNAGAIIDTPSTQGQTPLHTAVLCCKDYYDYISLPDISVCQTLISHGAVINKQDTKRNTPLHLLCQVDSHTKVRASCGYVSHYKDLYRSMVTLFLDHGANRQIKNNRGKRALRGWCKTLTD